MASDDGWGNKPGVLVNQKLVRMVEEMPQVATFRVSLEGVRCVDVSFARESVINLAKRYRGDKGFCLVDIEATDDIEVEDILDNWRLAAIDQQQPMTVWTDDGPRIIGPQPTEPTQQLLSLVLKRKDLGTPEAAKTLKKELNNVSTRLKNLTDRGFILRQEIPAQSGGVEFRYRAIG
tara:strand:+ start:4658 stop:5188 length:531 start_codon:yes stop_codon:yes gene_type:complete